MNTTNSSNTPETNMQRLVGHTIDNRYRLTHFLDQGNFGAVFRAEQLAYGVVLREVAVKVGRTPMTDLEARTCFRDALIMTRVVDTITDSALRDRFITVHDAGRCPDDNTPLAGRPYMVMELVPGAGLDHHLETGPFPLKRAMHYFDQILKGVAFMHREIRDETGQVRPVVHRDLKPANILVIRKKDGPDQLKITDFGLALEVDSLLLGWTESGGDMSCLAPESFSHNICSPQSDVYSLGLLFYAMISGCQPFRHVGHLARQTGEPDPEAIRRLHLRARQEERFDLLDSHEELKSLPQVAGVIRNALTPDMASRPYRDAGELLADWQRARREKTILRVNHHPWERVAELVAECEQRYSDGERRRGDRLLARAMEINRDPALMPKSKVNGRAYLLEVRRLLREGEVEAAAETAKEGYLKTACRSTCLALAEYYGQVNPALKAHFLRQAGEQKNQE